MSEDDDPFLLIRGRFLERKGLPLNLCSGSDEVSMFVLAHGGMAIPVSFLAEDGDAETCFGFV